MKILLIAATLHVGSVMPSYGNDNCRLLEEMNRQYAGVVLTVTQKAIKKKLVWWYRRHCLN